MKKKIMLIVPMLHQGGFERICALTAKLLNGRHEVFLVIFSAEDMIYDVSGIRLIDLKLGAVDGKLGKVKNLLKRIRRLKKIKRELSIDISYSFGVTANIANVLSKCQDHVWTGIRGYGVLQEKRKMQLICKKADKVVSCTKVMEEDINRIFGTKSSAVLYNPCNVSEIKKLKESEEFGEGASEKAMRIQEFLDRPGKLIVSMGREDDLKGFWHLIKSLYLLKKQMQDIKLMIIGEGEYTQYRKLAEELGMERDVLFTGVMKNPFSLLAKADVYALTSESEGFPNALIEAMACGIPCVSVNCKTGPAEILNDDYKECADQTRVYLGDYGLITPVFVGEKNLNAKEFTKEEEMFAKELERMLTDTELSAGYKEKALKRAEEFSLEAYTKNIEGLIITDAEN
ncbi:MAG: glycosyltransferase [Lachnospiraceae bacterium]|nr:glycosyltransferase [Lachnospiraceae bacterium]